MWGISHPLCLLARTSMYFKKPIWAPLVVHGLPSLARHGGSMIYVVLALQPTATSENLVRDVHITRAISSLSTPSTTQFFSFRVTSMRYQLSYNSYVISCLGYICSRRPNYFPTDIPRGAYISPYFGSDGE